MVIATGSPDLGVFSRYKSFGDFQKEAENTALAQAAAKIDNASKANIYKTQVLSAAAGSGDQGIYQGALQHLSQNGIDVSDVPADLATGKAYTDAARLAQSPLGSLLGTALKAESNVTQAGVGVGDPSKGAQIAPFSANILRSIAGMPAAQVGSMPAAQAATMTSPAINSTPLTQPMDQGSIPIPTKETQVAAIDGPIPTVDISQTRTQSPTINSINPPVKDELGLETPSNFNARLDAYKATPEYKRQEKMAETTGDINAKDVEAAKKADELTKRLDMNLQAMEKLNSDVPSSGFVPQGSKVYLNQALAANGLANGNPAVASHQFDKINNDQILSDIQQFVATGGANTRINQTLEKIVQAASGIDKTASPEARAAMLKAARAEIANKNATQQNVVGGNQQYQAIPVTAASVGQVPAQAAAYLKANPNLAPDFDSKYGAGTSKYILGN